MGDEEAQFVGYLTEETGLFFGHMQSALSHYLETKKLPPSLFAGGCWGTQGGQGASLAWPAFYPSYIKLGTPRLGWDRCTRFVGGEAGRGLPLDIGPQWRATCTGIAAAAKRTQHAPSLAYRRGRGIPNHRQLRSAGAACADKHQRASAPCLQSCTPTPRCPEQTTGLPTLAHNPPTPPIALFPISLLPNTPNPTRPPHPPTSLHASLQFATGPGRRRAGRVVAPSQPRRLLLCLRCPFNLVESASSLALQPAAARHGAREHIPPATQGCACRPLPKPPLLLPNPPRADKYVQQVDAEVQKQAAAAGSGHGKQKKEKGSRKPTGECKVFSGGCKGLGLALGRVQNELVFSSRADAEGVAKGFCLALGRVQRLGFSFRAGATGLLFSSRAANSNASSCLNPGGEGWVVEGWGWDGRVRGRAFLTAADASARACTWEGVQVPFMQAHLSPPPAACDLLMNEQVAATAGQATRAPHLAACKMQSGDT